MKSILITSILIADLVSNSCTTTNRKEEQGQHITIKPRNLKLGYVGFSSYIEVQMDLSFEEELAIPFNAYFSVRCQINSQSWQDSEVKKILLTAFYEPGIFHNGNFSANITLDSEIKNGDKIKCVPRIFQIDEFNNEGLPTKISALWEGCYSDELQLNDNYGSRISSKNKFFSEKSFEECRR